MDKLSLKVRGLDYHSMLLNIVHGYNEGERFSFVPVKRHGQAIGQE